MNTLEVIAPTGQTLTAALYPLGSDTAAVSGITLTERTNAKGVYRGTFTNGPSGEHRVVVLDGVIPIVVTGVALTGVDGQVAYATDAVPADKTGYSLTTAYDAAKTAAQASDIPAGLTAADVWGYVTRTLTANPGVTAQDVWEYATRALTDKTGFAPSTGDIRTELATELAALDAAVSTRSTFNPLLDTVAHVTLADTVTNLTNSPDVPTETEIAAQVRVELASELASLDAPISTRSTLTALDIPQGLTAQQVWEYVTRTLTTASGISAQDVWEYATRELTQQVTIDLTPLDTTLQDLTAQVTEVNERIVFQVPAGPVVTIPAPSTGQTTAWAACYDEHGVPEVGVSIDIKLAGTGAVTGSAWDGKLISIVSNAQGIASAPIPRQVGLRFACRRNHGPWVTFTGVDADSLELPAIIGL